MEYKKEIEKLLLDLKNLGISRKDIEKEFGFNTNYISQALSRGGNEQLLDKLRRLLKTELLKQQKPALPGDQFNRERALLKVLFHRVIKLEAQRLGLPEETVKAELEKDTTIAISDLEG